MILRIYLFICIYEGLDLPPFVSPLPRYYNFNSNETLNPYSHFLIRITQEYIVTCGIHELVTISCAVNILQNNLNFDSINWDSLAYLVYIWSMAKNIYLHMLWFNKNHCHCKCFFKKVESFWLGEIAEYNPRGHVYFPLNLKIHLLIKSLSRKSTY